jgi:hypothetical protein
VTADHEIAAALVGAIHSGDIAAVERIVADNPELARGPLGSRFKTRTALHVVADRPGTSPTALRSLPSSSRPAPTPTPASGRGRTTGYQNSAGSPPLGPDVPMIKERGDRMTVQRMDNVGIVVDDLSATIAFLRELDLELEGQAVVEGE